MFSMPGPMEWILILAVVLVLFGAKRLPKLGSSLGEGIRNFKKSISGTDEESSAKASDSEKKSIDTKE